MPQSDLPYTARDKAAELIGNIWLQDLVDRGIIIVNESVPEGEMHLIDKQKIMHPNNQADLLCSFNVEDR